MRGLLLGVLVHGSIVLFNRPQALVPPHLRDEPGALAERRARRAPRGALRMGFFSRGKGNADPLTAFREPTIAAGEPDITTLLQQLDVPFQRKGDAWLVEVGGAWATFGWIPRDATLAGWIDYAERARPQHRPGARADARPGSPPTR